MDKIIIVGGGGHAKVVISILQKNNNYEIVGYTDMEDRGNMLGVRYIGDDNILEKLKQEGCSSAAVGIGSIGDISIREKVWNKLKDLGFNLPAIISKDAVVNNDVSIGQGTVVMDGAVIQPGTVIGECCIINTRSSIDHDCEIKDFVHVAPGVTLSGGVKIGKHSHLGMGANVIQYLNIGDKCIIAAGATVIKDCEDNKRYRGVPAKEF
ncbi:acetyltransferase [Candidatus Woesearchaeota archaeon]|nr:acetyltransferase [Candidatus Woesearchaeota archaeon]